MRALCLITGVGGELLGAFEDGCPDRELIGIAFDDGDRECSGVEFLSRSIDGPRLLGILA